MSQAQPLVYLFPYCTTFLVHNVAGRRTAPYIPRCFDCGWLTTTCQDSG